MRNLRFPCKSKFPRWLTKCSQNTPPQLTGQYWIPWELVLKVLLITRSCFNILCSLDSVSLFQSVSRLVNWHLPGYLWQVEVVSKRQGIEVFLNAKRVGSSVALGCWLYQKSIPAWLAKNSDELLELVACELICKTVNCWHYLS